MTAAKDITQTGVLTSTKAGDISITSSTGAVSIGVGSTVFANATIAGDIILSAKGNVTTTAIGDKTVLASLGSLKATSTDGDIKFADAALGAKDTAGIDIDLTAKTLIGGTTNATTAATFTNVGGNINAKIAGTAKAFVNLTAETKGVVNLAASNTGGLVTTVTQAGTAGDGSVSTISLGNAKSGESNALTVTGTVDTLNITGGTGVDTVVLATAQNLKTGTIALGSGADVLSFAGTTGGVAINLGSTTVTFADTGSTTVAAGGAVGFNAASASSKVVTGAAAFNLTVSGISEVIGTASADHIVANAEGTKITGGAGADTIVLGAGADTVVFAFGVADAGDTIINFNLENDTVDFSGTSDVAATTNATKYVEFAAAAVGVELVNGFSVIGTNATALDAVTIKTFMGTAGNHGGTAFTLDALTAVQYFAVDNGVDTGIYRAAAATDATFANATVTLIATLVGLADATSLSADNFADFVA